MTGHKRVFSMLSRDTTIIIMIVFRYTEKCISSRLPEFPGYYTRHVYTTSLCVTIRGLKMCLHYPFKYNNDFFINDYFYRTLSLHLYKEYLLLKSRT